MVREKELFRLVGKSGHSRASLALACDPRFNRSLSHDFPLLV